MLTPRPFPPVEVQLLEGIYVVGSTGNGTHRLDIRVIPSRGQNNCLEFKDVSGVVLEAFTVHGYWPAFVVMEDATFVTVRNLEDHGIDVPDRGPISLVSPQGLTTF
jgi:hypothetical protein